jgi:hypothetical protein
MTTSIAPPSLSALNDALAIIRLALNPQEALEVTEHLHKETQAHSQMLDAIRGRHDQLNAREQALILREKQVEATLSDLTDRETAVAAQSRKVSEQTNALQQQQAEHTRAVSDHAAEHSSRSDAVKTEEDRVLVARRSLEQATASQNTQLTQREEQLHLAEEDLKSRVQRMKELAA